MIIILDDTFDIIQKDHDLSYLQNILYMNICKVYSKPTMKDFRDILGNIGECKMLCNHKSLRLCNNNGEYINGEKAIHNFYTKMTDNNIKRIEFGRDIHTNIKANTLDKYLFYSNLKPFIDYYYTNKQMETKILFYGENYIEIERLSIINKLIDEITELDINKYVNSQYIQNGLELLFPTQDKELIIGRWRKKKLSKKSISELINNEIRRML